ncbi:MAG TPA: CGNR zinc finger domain-containing protein [Acidimicrobiales bacterium]|nr:CGNR zinc finger domain-containing protein [Acidimicrobiales bacterium]
MGLPSWVPADETKPAPVPLLLVQAFVNTWEGDSGADMLAGRSTATSWFSDAQLLQPGAYPTAREVVFARAVRESIRALLVQNGGGPAPGSADLEGLAALAHKCRFGAVLGRDGTVELEPAPVGGRLKLGEFLVIMRDSQRDGTWPRLKACHNSDCRWAFYDRSHAGRGAWCDMTVCGNRIKNRNLRSRRSAVTQ